MKLSIRVSTRVTQRLTWKKATALFSLVVFFSWGLVSLIELMQSSPAYATSCESSYTLDWSNPATYSVTCGTINSAQWTVKGTVCTFYSPVLNAGGIAGQPAKVADITLRINQGGNLEEDDSCWVYFKVNGEITHTYTITGDVSNGVFCKFYSLTVPAAGNYQVQIKMKNDKSNESWYLKKGDVTTCLKTITPHPLTLGEFRATFTGKGVHLTWTTITEIDNDYFTLERSGNGTEFLPITVVDGAGHSNSALKYEFTDEEPLAGLNYYRLRQTDFDGKSSLSNTITTTTSGNLKSDVDVQAFPNPFDNHFTIRFNSPNDAQYTIQLMTVEGKVVHTQPASGYAGANSFLCELPGQLKKGTYVLRLLNGDSVAGYIKLQHN